MPGFRALSSLAAGPASLPASDRHLDAPAPAGLSISLSAEERARVLPEGNGTETGGVRGPRRDRTGVRIIIPDDDHCVPRPPPQRF
jgi:hypothetical protein